MLKITTMSGYCKWSNYSKGRLLTVRNICNAVVIDGALDKEELTKKLNGIRSFALNVENSEDPEKFEESLNLFINDLIDRINKNIDKFNNELKDGDKKPELNDDDKKVINDIIKGLVNPREERKDLENAQLEAVIDGSDNNTTVSNKEKVSYKKEKKFIFGAKNSIINLSRENNFRRLLLTSTIINTMISRNNARGNLITDLASLNQGIIDFMDLEIQKILAFFKARNIYPKQRKPIITLKDTGYRVLSSGFYSILDDMEEYITDRKSKDRDLFDEELHSSYIDYSEGNSSLLYDAVTAFMNLEYFDDTMKSVMGGHIKIDLSMSDPIQKINEDGSPTPTVKFKYSIASDNSNIANHWGIEDHDALKEMGKLSQLLLVSIPIRSISDRNTNIQYGYLTPRNFLDACSVMIFAGRQIKVNQSTVKSVRNFKDYATRINTKPELLKEMFRLLFNKDNKNLLNILKEHGLNEIRLDYLYSVYIELFVGILDKTASWEEIELNYTKFTGLPPIISPVNTVVREAIYNTQMLYLQSIYNPDIGIMETSIKESFNYNRLVFDTVNQINTKIWTNITRNSLLSQYILSREGKNDNDNMQYSLEFNGTGLRCTIECTGDKVDGLLYKDQTTSNRFDFRIEYNGQRISIRDFVNSIKINSDSEINEILWGVTNNNGEVSDNIKILRDLLTFVDNVLGTSFMTNKEGVKTFNLYLQQSPNRVEGLRSLLITASRGLLINLINAKFEQAQKENPNRYNIFNLYKFLNENNEEVYPEERFNNPLSNYFINTEDNGQQLSVISPYSKLAIALGKARCILLGDANESTISFYGGLRYPNFSPYFMGNDYVRQFKKESKSGASRFLLKQRGMLNSIEGCVVDSEVRVMEGGTVKAVKKMTEGELFKDKIMNKYIIPLLSNNHRIYVQSTTFSDKKKPLAHVINLDSLMPDENGNNTIYDLMQSLQIDFLDVSDLDDNQTFSGSLVKILHSTVGRAYYELYDNVITDYKKILSILSSSELKKCLLNGQFSLYKFNEWLQTKNEKELIQLVDDYNELHKDDKLTFIDLVHYQKINGALQVNPLLEYFAKDIYDLKDISKLKRRIKKEQVNFVNGLIDKLITFKINFVDGKIDTEDPLYRFARKVMGSKEAVENWMQSDGNQLALAKIKRANGSIERVFNFNITLQEGDELLLNPVLNTYFMLDVVYGTNLRLLMTGTEIAHKPAFLKEVKLKETIKTELGKLKDNNNKPIYDITTINKIILQIGGFGDPKDPTITFSSLRHYITTVGEDILLRYVLNKVLYDLLYLFEASSLLAQIKRNVIATATMHPFLLNLLDGIMAKMNIAVMHDDLSKLFNFTGLKDTMDACDGSALENPFMHIIENLSLGENSTDWVKKPIQHGYENKTMSAVLLKYAIDAISNLWMRQSEGNNLNNDDKGITLKDLFKKMSNFRWHNKDWNGHYNEQDNTWTNSKIDLINGCEFKVSQNHRIDFSTNILQGKRLFYRNGKNRREIIGFGRTEDGIYYTREKNVSDSGNSSVETPVIVVYHLFDNTSSEHNKVELSETELFNPSNYLDSCHTIDSLYELHTALGGIWSMEKGSEGTLIYSEASNYAVVNFINHVASKTDKDFGEEGRPLTQEGYYQPLKDMMIHLVANQSAVKSGSGNINQASSYFDKTPLTYMTIDTDVYGIQLNSDHEADEGTMTEFSQVISALDAGGRYHNMIARQVYRMLGLVAINLSLVELNSIKEFREGEQNSTLNKSKLYDIVGRFMFNAMLTKSNTSGLTDAILNEIQKTFNLNANHVNDTFKIPFSDININSLILPTIIGIINRKSIKRRFPGLGAVICAGFNMSMVYELGDEIYLFEDLLKLAIKAGKTSDKVDVSENHKDLVKQYLHDKQKEQVALSAEMFGPTSNVLIEYIGLDGLSKQYHARLDDIEEYYDFLDNTVKYLFKKLVSQKNVSIIQELEDEIIYTLDGKQYIFAAKDINLYKDVTAPRNLAPQRVEFDIVLDNGTTKHMNIFNTWAVRDRCQRGSYLNGNNAAVLKTFDDLEKGIYEDRDGKVYKIINIKNQAAEILMSNLYLTKFNMSHQDSLPQIKEDGAKYFKESNKVNLPKSPNYALLFLRGDKSKVYISFNSPVGTAHKQHLSTIKEKVEDPEGKVKYKFTAISDNNIKLYLVGRQIVRDDLKYNNELEVFVYSEGKNAGLVVENQNLFSLDVDGTTVLEYVEFVSKYKLKENGYNKTMYYINTGNISRVMLTPTLLKGGEKIEKKLRYDKTNFTATILLNLYNSEDFMGMFVNNQLTEHAYRALPPILYTLSTKLNYNPILKNYIKNDTDNCLYGLVSKATEGRNEYNELIFNITPIKNTIVRDNYLEALNTEIYSSFLAALNFTAARIPAQDLQSFMHMRNVGFTGSNNAYCYVSHWLFWLQGNDMDIDKSYCMGLCLDANGKFIGWSNLFDYSTYETLTLSLKMPYPEGRKYTKTDDGIDIDNFIEQIGESKQLNDKPTEIEAYAKLISHIYSITDPLYTLENENGEISTKLKYTDSELSKEVISKLVQHEKTKIPENQIEEANKNFISVNIQRTIQGLRNIVRAWTPLVLTDTREGAKLSNKGLELNKMTLMNPLSKLSIQYQAISGRDCTGIAANGEKASFIWHYHFNEILKNGTDDDLKNINFEFKTSRIIGRANGTLQEMTIRCLPDVNFEGVKKEREDALRDGMLVSNIPAGLIISLYISLATDNMKEMVLSNINATSNMMKCHLLLTALGVQVKDTISFMTCPVISFIDAITQENIFENNTFTMDEAMSIALGKYDVVVKKYLSLKDINIVSSFIGLNNEVETDENESSTSKKTPFADFTYKDFEELVFPAIESYKGTKATNSTFVHLNNLRTAMQLILQQKIKYGITTVTDEIKADVSEFKKVWEASDEFSKFGQILALNQGLPTVKEKLSSFISNLRSLYGRKGDDAFDIIKFIYDVDYLQEVVDYYNDKKKLINIFDVLLKTPLFKAILDLMGFEIYMDKELSVCSKAYNIIDDSLNGTYVTDNYRKKLLKAILGQIIVLYLTKSNIKIPYKKGTQIFDILRRLKIAAEDGEIKFENVNDIATFKHYMEAVVIPNLKIGRYWTKDENGETILLTNGNLVDNAFLQSLIKESNTDGVFYKINRNMNTINDTEEGKIALNELTKGIEELQGIKIGNISIADMFALYNLIVHRNLYGRDRMTVLFDSVIRNNNANSILKDYMHFIGLMDMIGDVVISGVEEQEGQKKDAAKYDFLFYPRDAMIEAAPIVKSLRGQVDPFVKMNDDNGNLSIYMKHGRRYSKYNEDMLPLISSEDASQKQVRVRNNKLYFVLGGPRSAKYDWLLNSIANQTDDVIDVMFQLMLDAIIQVTKIC